MANRCIDIISAKTAAEDSDTFGFTHGDVTSLTLFASGLGAGEEIPLYITHNGTTWTEVHEEGTQTKLTNTNTVVRITGAGNYRVSKGITAGAVGVHMFIDKE